MHRAEVLVPGSSTVAAHEVLRAPKAGTFGEPWVKKKTLTVRKPVLGTIFLLPNPFFGVPCIFLTHNHLRTVGKRVRKTWGAMDCVTLGAIWEAFWNGLDSIHGSLESCLTCLDAEAGVEEFPKQDIMPAEDWHVGNSKPPKVPKANEPGKHQLFPQPSAAATENRFEAFGEDFPAVASRRHRTSQAAPSGVPRGLPRHAVGCGALVGSVVAASALRTPKTLKARGALWGRCVKMTDSQVEKTNMKRFKDARRNL